jgi:hypothetical protein
VVGGKVTVVGAVLTHGGDPETVVEGCTAEGDGLEEFGDFFGTVFGGGLVVVRGFACQDCSRWRVLDGTVPREIGCGGIHWRFRHCAESLKKSETCTGYDCGLFSQLLGDRMMVGGNPQRGIYVGVIRIA